MEKIYNETTHKLICDEKDIGYKFLNNTNHSILMEMKENGVYMTDQKIRVHRFRKNTGIKVKNISGYGYVLDEKIKFKK